MALVAACLLLTPLRDRIDALIGASFLVYVFLLARLWRRGADAFADAPLSVIADLRRWLAAAIGLMSFMLTVDTLIAVDFALAGGRRAPQLIALATLVLWPLGAMVWVPVLEPVYDSVRPHFGQAVLVLLDVAHLSVSFIVSGVLAAWWMRLLARRLGGGATTPQPAR